jgi:hypothetical protein
MHARGESMRAQLRLSRELRALARHACRQRRWKMPAISISFDFDGVQISQYRNFADMNLCGLHRSDYNTDKQQH